MVRPSLYFFERSLPFGYRVCLNYFVCSSALLKGLFTPVFLQFNVLECTVITIAVTLLRGVTVFLAVCGAVSIFEWFWTDNYVVMPSIFVAG